MDFTFKTIKNSIPIEISDKLTIPLESDVTLREVCYRIMKKNSLPEEVFPELYEQLDTIIEEYVENYESDYAEKVVANREALNSHVQNILNDQVLSDSSSFETKSTTSKDSTGVDDNFYQMYHEIVHSGKLTTQLIQLELHNSEVIKSILQDKQKCLEIVSQMDEDNLQNLDPTQFLSGNEDLQKIISKNSNFMSEEETWQAQIDKTRKKQKREFRAWIKNTHEHYMDKKNSLTNNPSENDEANRGDFVEFMPEDEIHIEESYTINLGSQLKTTHNLRLISVDILKFCSTLCTTHRIQTAMSLYSNSLSAIVLLVDKEILSRNETREGKIGCFVKFIFFNLFLFQNFINSV